MKKLNVTIKPPRPQVAPVTPESVIRELERDRRFGGWR